MLGRRGWKEDDFSRIHGGWSRRDSSSVTDLLSMIYHIVFKEACRDHCGSTSRVPAGCLSNSDAGKSFQGVYGESEDVG